MPDNPPLIPTHQSMDLHLSTMFDFLNKHSLFYYLLTDFESDFNSKDIDLYVPAEDRPKFEKMLFDLGWYRRKEPALHVNHYFYYSPNSEVYLDIKYTLTFANGIDECCTYTGIGQRPVKQKPNNLGVSRPQGLDAILLYAAHLAFKERGKLEEKHKTYLSQYIDLYRNEVDSTHQDVLERIGRWLEQSFPYDTATLQQIIKPFFRIEKKRMTRSQGLKYGYGLSVLFLGTDGVGKTTLVEAVGSKLNLKNNRLYLGAGESSWTSQLMKQAYNYEVKLNPLNKVYSFVKTFAILPLELFLRIAPVIKKSRYNITLIDRFPGFVFLQRKFGRTLLYQTILPKPDLVFFLHAAPEVLMKRKPNETSLERSINDMKRFEKVADIVSEGNYKSVDTSQLTIEEARDYIICEIFNHPKMYKRLLTTEPCN